MATKKKIALVTGGFTGELSVSLKSVQNVYRELDKVKYDVYQIFITKESWYYEDLEGKQYPVDKNDFSIRIDDQSNTIVFDVAFICIHGSPGEDGLLQAYFELIGLPYTSCGHLAATITMNKAITKTLVKDTPQLYVAKSVVVRKKDDAATILLENNVSFPVFVKPNNGGSSVATSKVHNIDELSAALEKAFDEDVLGNVLIEEYIQGREFSMGVYRNRKGQLIALPPSEVILSGEFFDFNTKYKSDRPIEVTPAELNDEYLERMQNAGKYIFSTLDCKGVIRVDFIIQAESENLYFLEVNTIPGQTNDSFIPKQLRAAGINTTEFFNGLIEEALFDTQTETIAHENH